MMPAPTIPTTVCTAPECDDVAEAYDDRCAAHNGPDTGTCTYVYNLGRFDEPPEGCDEDAEPGTDRCSLHTDDVLGEDDEDGHDYYED
jgi:hypothetical protein